MSRNLFDGRVEVWVHLRLEWTHPEELLLGHTHYRSQGTLFLEEVPDLLNSVESDEKLEDVVSSLEDPEDPQIPHPPLNTDVLHKASPAEDLNGLIADIPSALGGEDLAHCSLQLVLRC